MSIKPEKFNKLPEWVKSEICVLQSHIRDLNEKIAQINGEQDTDIFILDTGMNRPLPKNSYIRIMVGKKYIDVYKMKSDKGEEKVRVSSHGVIKITPSASNSCYIGVEE